VSSDTSARSSPSPSCFINCEANQLEAVCCIQPLRLPVPSLSRTLSWVVLIGGCGVLDWLLPQRSRVDEVTQPGADGPAGHVKVGVAAAGREVWGLPARHTPVNLGLKNLVERKNSVGLLGVSWVIQSSQGPALRGALTPAPGPPVVCGSSRFEGRSTSPFPSALRTASDG